MSPPQQRDGSSLNTDDKQKKRGVIRGRIAAFIVLVSVWTLLWGTFNPLNILSGVLVAIIILVFLPLPPITFEGRFRFKGIAVFLGKFVTLLVTASVQISWLAFRLGRHPGTAIAQVKLRINTDLNITLVAEALSLIPGSLILEADPESGTLYIHVIGVESMEEVVEYTKDVLALEARLVRAIGSDEELRIIEKAEAQERTKSSPQKGAS